MSKQPIAPTTWKHTDSDPTASMASALDARSYVTRPDGSTLTTAERTRLVRTLAIATLYAVENVSVVGVPPSAGEMDSTIRLGATLRGDLFASRAHCYAASTLARTWMLFADPGRHVIQSATSRDGETALLSKEGDPNAPGETAFPPLLIAAVIIVALAVHAAAICYVGQAGAEVIDRKLTQDAATARMLSTQARAVAMVDDHSERERAAGHPLPWSPQELQLLDSLLGTQREIATRTNSAMPNPFAGAVEKAAEVGEKAALVSAGIGTLALIGGGLYLLTR